MVSVRDIVHDVDEMCIRDRVRFAGETVETHSVVMRSYTGTLRWIDAFHNLTQLRLRNELSLRLDS